MPLFWNSNDRFVLVNNDFYSFSKHTTFCFSFSVFLMKLQTSIELTCTCFVFANGRNVFIFFYFSKDSNVSVAITDNKRKKNVLGAHKKQNKKKNTSNLFLCSGEQISLGALLKWPLMSFCFYPWTSSQERKCFACRFSPLPCVWVAFIMVSQVMLTLVTTATSELNWWSVIGRRAVLLHLMRDSNVRYLLSSVGIVKGCSNSR